MVDDNNVEYVPVSSSNLYAVGYDEENGNLFVQFKEQETGGPGLTYVFYHCPPTVHAELMAADSKGKYLNARVKNVYSYDRLQ